MPYAFDVLRRGNEWRIAFGDRQGDTLAANIQIRLTDEGLRGLHKAVVRFLERKVPADLALPVGPDSGWTGEVIAIAWEDVPKLRDKLAIRVAQLDSGEPIPESQYVSFE